VNFGYWLVAPLSRGFVHPLLSVLVGLLYRLERHVSTASRRGSSLLVLFSIGFSQVLTIYFFVGETLGITFIAAQRLLSIIAGRSVLNQVSYFYTLTIVYEQKIFYK